MVEGGGREEGERECVSGCVIDGEREETWQKREKEVGGSLIQPENHFREER